MQTCSLKKMSKKAQREYHRQQRGSWNGIDPVSRIAPSPKTYDRNRMKRSVRNSVDE